MDKDTENIISYANHCSITIGPGDSVITYRWIIPEYDTNGNVIGNKMVREINITSPTDLLIKNANTTLDLAKKIQEAQEKQIE